MSSLLMALAILGSGLALSIGGSAVVPAPASAVPGSPGSPSAPTVVYREDFENGVGATTVGLASYVGASGQTYSADPFWLNLADCNGVVLRYDATTFAPGHCTLSDPSSARNNSRRMADVLGQVAAGAAGGTAASPTNASDATTQANHAISGWTTSITGATNQVQFRTGDLNIVTSSTRYYSMSVDVAEASCAFLGGINNSKLVFYFDTAGTPIRVNAAPIRACTDPSTGEYTSPLLAGGWYNGGNSIRAGHYFADGALLLTPAQIANLKIVMRNETGSNAGNDAAFDNLTLIDATPQLDKAFSPEITRVGQTSTLTFTITNREDLGAKYDWAFTDDLPSGLVVAANPNLGGTCIDHGGAAFQKTADPGGTSIAVTGGDLAIGEASCTITVDVTSGAHGSYVNGPDNISDVVGLDLPADATVTFIDPAISLVKSVDPGTVSAAGDSVTYTFVATNTGTDPLTDVTIDDPLPGLGSLDCTPAAPAALDPGDAMTCTATYDATQGDIDAGAINNTATATGLDQIGGPVSDTDDAQVAATQAPAIDLVKDADVPSFDAAGDIVTYTYTATNTGNTTLDGVVITDPLSGLSALSCTPPQPTSLAPGEKMTCTATYPTTQADVDAGQVDSDATATGTAPDQRTVSDMDDAPVPGAQSPALDLTKAADLTSFGAAGETITYTFEARNVGNTTLAGVSISDPLPGLSALDCTPAQPADLAPGDAVRCTATYDATQGDLDAGSVDNTATASGTAPGGSSVTDEASASVPGAQTVAIDVTKDPDLAFFSADGETITYALSATNTGNTTLTGVEIVDPLAGLSALDCTPAAPATLAPGETMSCTATYDTTQADVDAGSVDNTATATGSGPGGSSVTDEASATVPGDQAPEITVTKDADVTSFDSAGDPVVFTYTATNTGNTTLTDVVITDPQTGLPALGCIPAQPATLAPGESMTCTSTYTTTQADVDGGLLDTDATATGTAPDDSTVTATDDAPVPGTQAPAITLVKDADATSFDSAGDPIGYTYTATNTGNTTLTDVVITDPQTGLPALGCIPAQPATLAPGESMTCTATYTTVQADVDGGEVNTTATVTGTAPNDSQVSATDDAPVPGAAVPGITLTKDADVSSFDSAGDPVVFTYVATNTGSTTLTDVVISDPLTGLSTLDCTPAQPVTLAPGESMTCTATYTTTQADVDQGLVDSDATVVGTAPDDSTVTDTDDAPVPGDQAAAIDIDKVADATSFDAAGDPIGYTFVVTNVGNTTLTDVTVVDPLDGLSAVTCSPAQPATLAPDATMTCLAAYDTTQADLDRGDVANTATATGTDPGGDDVTDVDTVTVPGAQLPAIDLVKTADKGDVTAAGQTITYSFEATNTGNVTLDGVTIADPLPGLSALACNPDAPATLVPGATISCTATYEVTQADIDAGHIANTATATGTPPSGEPVTDDDTVDVPATQAPVLDLVKSSSTASFAQPGDIVDYTFTATNGGNTSLTDVTITDPLPGLSALDCAPAQPATLAPGESISCTASVEATQADIDAGRIDNTATATGTPPGGEPVTDDDSVTVPGEQSPDLVLDKVADRTRFTAAGDTITYSLTATNTGTVTLTDVSIDDPMAGLSELDCTPGQPATLAPGEELRCTATYRVTAADVKAGKVANAATATGTDPGGNPVDDDDEVTVPGTKDPGATENTTTDNPNGTANTTADQPGGMLPRTGAALGGVALLGFGLLLAGAGAMVAGRRRAAARG